MVPTKFRYQVEVWGRVQVQNELLENDWQNNKIGNVWAEIIPQTGSLSNRQGVDTILTNVTHKIVMRYDSGKNIKQDMWFIYRGHRFDIRFILNPYFIDETLEMFCEEVIG